MEKIIQQINKATLEFLVPLTLDETYKRVVEQGVKLVKGEDGLIVIRENGNFKNVYGSSKSAKNSKPRNKGYTYNTFIKRKAFVVHSDEYKETHPDVAKENLHSVIFIPLYYKKQSFGVLIVRSYLNQHFTDEELRILKLFGSLASLALRKTQLYDESKKNVELKDKFLALAAHELRTPLTSMNGFIQLIHKRATLGKKINIDWTESLLNESKRLTFMIEEILDINKINAKRLKLNYQSNSLLEILKDVVSRAKQMYPEHVFYLHTDTSPSTVISDYNYLEKAIFNIVENAAKFTPIANPIEIDLKNNGTHRVITVQDKGRGIKKEDLPHIFEGFYKAGDNEEEGMGLGLYFSYSIISQHKGKISIQSQQHKGTNVEIKLPKA